MGLIQSHLESKARAKEATGESATIERYMADSLRESEEQQRLEKINRDNETNRKLQQSRERIDNYLESTSAERINLHESIIERIKKVLSSLEDTVDNIDPLDASKILSCYFDCLQFEESIKKFEYLDSWASHKSDHLFQIIVILDKLDAKKNSNGLNRFYAQNTRNYLIEKSRRLCEILKKLSIHRIINSNKDFNSYGVYNLKKIPPMEIMKDRIKNFCSEIDNLRVDPVISLCIEKYVGTTSYRPRFFYQDMASLDNGPTFFRGINSKNMSIDTDDGHSSFLFSYLSKSTSDLAIDLSTIVDLDIFIINRAHEYYQRMGGGSVPLKSVIDSVKNEKKCEYWGFFGNGFNGRHHSYLYYYENVTASFVDNVNEYSGSQGALWTAVFVLAVCVYFLPWWGGLISLGVVSYFFNEYNERSKRNKEG